LKPVSISVSDVELKRDPPATHISENIGTKCAGNCTVAVM
jgi:hypothetical protein